jgi:hypothetical protein
MATVNKQTVQARDGQVIVGLQKHLQNLASLVILGVTYTPAELMALFQSDIDSANAVTTAKAKHKDLVLANRALGKKVRLVRTGLRGLVRNMFGDVAEILADFGFTPPKVAKLTADQKAQAAQKVVATRKVRHTMGKKQKKNVKGAVSVPATPSPALEASGNGPAVNPITGPSGSGSLPHTQ